ncbi:MAG: PAS domain S-box protein [Ectothiorhodospiraceae bacterium]|nr:PAS domain S-box protein [Ectothiorhodospiraceae bacterium]
MSAGWSRSGPIAVGLSVTLASLAAVWLLSGSLAEHEHQQRQSRPVQELATVRAQLESELNSTIHLTYGLTALVASDPELQEDQFKRISAELLHRSRHTSHLVLAPGNTIRHIHPLEGNETAMGLNLATQPEQRYAVFRAMEKRGLVVTGPVLLVQGGVALATREPVFIRDNDDERYWGLVTAVIFMDSLFEAAGLYSEDLGLRLALRNMDDNTLLLGDEGLFHRDSLRQEIRLSGVTWELAAEPLASGAGMVAYWQGLGVALSLAAGLAGWRLTGQRIALASSERKYRAVVDHLNDGVCIAQEGVFRFVNPRMTKISGYTEEELLGQPLTRIVPGSDGENLLERHRQRMEGFSVPAEYEVGIIRKDGEKRHVRLNTSLVDWHGRPAALGTVTDITERKRLETALRSNRNRLHAMIQAMPDIALILDDRGTYLDVFGGQGGDHALQPETLIGKRMVDVLPEALAQQFLGVVQAAITSGRVQTVEYALGRIAPTDDSHDHRQWYQGRVVTLHAYEHARPAVLWLAFNITDHKRTESSLKEREAAYQALVENSPDVIARLDPELRILYINSAVEHYAGVPADTLLGRRRPETLADPALAQLLEANYRKAFQERTTHMFEFRLRSPDGQILFFESRVVPERGSSEEVASVLVLERDITQRKR